MYRTVYYLLLHGLIIYTLFGHSELNGQTASNISQIEDGMADSSVILNLAIKAESFFLVNNDSVRYFSEKGIRLAEHLKYKKGLVHNNLMLANFFSHTGASPDSVRYYIKRAEQNIDTPSDVLTQKWLSLSYGELHHQMNQYERSIDYYLDYISHAKASHDHPGSALGHMRIGQALRHFRMFEESIKYHNIATEIGKEINDTSLLRINLDYLSLALEDNGQRRIAQQVRAEAARYIIVQQQAGKYYQNADLGFQFWNNENYDSSHYYFKQSLRFALEENNLSGIIENYGDLAMMSAHFGHIDQAHHYWEKFSKYQDKNTYASNFYLPYRADYERSIGQNDLAFDLLQRFIIQNRKVFNEDVSASVASQVTKYEVSLKEDEIEEMNTQIDKETKLRNYLILGLVALSFIGLFVWYQSSMKERLHVQSSKLAVQDLEMQKQKNRQLQTEQDFVAVQSMVSGQESERNRIARELHDGMGGFLSSLKLSLGALSKISDKNEFVKKINQSTLLIDKASVELRRIAQDLMPESLSKFGLVVAIEDLIEEISDGQDIEIRFQHYDLDPSLDDDFSLAVFRIIQELLHNVIKHANASEVIIQIIQHGRVLNITVEDNGQGLDKINTPKGQGLSNIKARISVYNGEIKIESVTQSGVSISISCEVPEFEMLKNS